MVERKVMESDGKHTIRQFLVTANVAMTAIGHGCVVGISAILIPSLRSPDSEIHATINEESWIASSVGLSLVMGNVFITLLLDKLGRKKCHILTVLPVLVGWFILVLSNNVAGLVAARIIQGIALGFFGSLGSIIVAEMTDPKHRGMFLTSFSLALTIGVLLSHALGTYFSWQTSTLICSFTTFTSLLMLFYTPESPSWLIAKGRYDEAREIFYWLRGTDEEHVAEFETMLTAQKLIRRHGSENLSLKTKMIRYFKYLMETCKKPEFFKPIIIMIVVYILYQFAGVNVMSSYATDLIEQLVGPDANAKLLMVVLDVERLLCNLFAVYLMKVMKRRMLLFSTGGICILSYFSKALYVYLRQKDMLFYDSQWIPITLIAVYMFSLTVGISAVPFALTGEIFPLEYRGLGSGISSFSLSINFFAAVKWFPILTDSIGLSLSYVVYASIVTVCMFVVWFMLPETKDRTLQDIEDEFRGYSGGDVKSAEPLTDMRVVDIRSSSHSIQVL